MKDEMLPILIPSNQDLSVWITNPYIAASTSDNTRRAYQSDIRHFEKWGGKLPASPEIIIRYLQAFAEKLNARTLSRRLTAIKNWHLYQSFPDPTAHPAVGKTLTGIARIHGKPKDKAWPLLPEDLMRIVLHLQADPTLANLRDNAILQVGFFGAFRRSELVSIRHEHIKWENEGIEIILPHSKTDQLHEGQYCSIPYGQLPLCPVRALKAWLEKANIEMGPIFRRIILNQTLSTNGLSGLSINHILKKHALACGISYAEQLSSHSLRRGLASSASRVGANISAIMRQGRWKQVNTVMEYIEASDRFKENAAGSVIQKVLEKE